MYFIVGGNYVFGSYAGLAYIDRISKVNAEQLERSYRYAECCRKNDNTKDTVETETANNSK